MTAVINWYRMLVTVKQRLISTRRQLLGKLSSEQQNDERLEHDLWDEICSYS